MEREFATEADANRDASPCHFCGHTDCTTRKQFECARPAEMTDERFEQILRDAPKPEHFNGAIPETREQAERRVGLRRGEGF